MHDTQWGVQLACLLPANVALETKLMRLVASRSTAASSFRRSTGAVALAPADMPLRHLQIADAYPSTSSASSPAAAPYKLP